MEYLRTPDEAFNDLPDFDYPPRYLEQQGLRQHYLDEGEGEVILCLHGEPSWSFLYRHFFPVLTPHYRVIAPDWFGFGRSDKPVHREDYSFAFHLQTLENFIEQLGLRNITLVVQDWGGLLGLSMVGKRPEWFSRLVIMNTFLPVGEDKMPWPFKVWKAFSQYSPVLPIGLILRAGTYRATSHDRTVIRAYDAPFPDAKYKAGARAFPALVPAHPDDAGTSDMQQARAVLGQWNKPCLVLFSDKDPILGGAKSFFEKLIPTAEGIPEGRIPDAGHFLQEDAGALIAGHIHEFVQRHRG